MISRNVAIDRAWPLLGLLLAVTAHAQVAAVAPIPSLPELAVKSYYLLDAGSGKELAESAADERLEPASLTKLMTAYVVFTALKDGSLKLTDRGLVDVERFDFVPLFAS